MKVLTPNSSNSPMVGWVFSQNLDSRVRRRAVSHLLTNFAFWGMENLRVGSGGVNEVVRESPPQIFANQSKGGANFAEFTVRRAPILL